MSLHVVSEHMVPTLPISIPVHKRTMYLLVPVVLPVHDKKEGQKQALLFNFRTGYVLYS